MSLGIKFSATRDQRPRSENKGPRAKDEKLRTKERGPRSKEKRSRNEDAFEIKYNNF